MLDKLLIEDTQRTPEDIDFKIPEYIDFEQTIPEDKSLRKMPDGTYK